MRLNYFIVGIVLILLTATMVTALAAGGGTAGTSSENALPPLVPIVTPEYPPTSAMASEFCNDINSCKKMQIDSVWVRIRGFLNLEEEKANKIWESDWGKTFEVVYTPPPPPEAYEGVSGENAFDELIKLVAREERVDARIIKAIMVSESNGNPQAISPYGCAGLMQICMDSVPTKLNFKTCKQDNTPQLCDGVNDDRFNPRKNLRMGTLIFKEKFDAMGNCGTDKLKATIAAYNAGQVVIKAAITANNNNCNSWEAVSAKITNQLLEAYFTDSWISTTIGSDVNANTWRTQKIDEINRYVTRFSENYEQFKNFN